MSDEEERLRQRAVEDEPDSVLARAKLAVLEDRLGRPRGSLFFARVVSRPARFGEPGLDVQAGGHCIVVDWGSTVTVVLLEAMLASIIERNSTVIPGPPEVVLRGDVLSLRSGWLRVDEEFLP